MIINTFKAELHKYLAEIKSYYPDQIVSLIVTYIFFMGFFIGLSKTELGQENLHIGFIFWFFASTIISEASISISYEKQTGTFEQLLLKPTHILCILSVKTLVWFIVSLVKVTILMIIVMLTIGIILPFNIKILPILFVTLVGLYGLGLILSGLTLIFTKTASFESILSYFLLFFTGGIVSLEKLPKVVVNISEMLPLTIGIRLSQNILIGNKITANDLINLIFNSGFYVLIGLIVFKLCYYYTKRDGLSTEY